MKFYFFIFFFLILIPIAIAPYGGETFHALEFEKCSRLYIKVTADEPIDPGEYEFLGCYERRSNYWKCYCHDDYRLHMKTQTNTLNKYTIKATARYKIYKDCDRDGVSDKNDKCKHTPINTKVDKNGCSAEQFCNSHKIKNNRYWRYYTHKCYRADWKNNEWRYWPRDCRVSNGKCVSRSYTN